MITHHNITIDEKIIRAFCIKHGVRKLALFGSALREDFIPESDIDILVEFRTGEVVGLFKLFDMEEELSGMLNGRAIDLRTPYDISRNFRDNVLKEAEVWYEAE